MRGIDPEAVTQETFDEFRIHLDDTLLKSPDAVFAEIARGWRAAQAAVESWPRLAVPIPDRRKVWTLPWTTFPNSLLKDFRDWSNRLAGRDLLEEVPFRPVCPATLLHRERQIRAFASALVLRGRDPTTITSLRDLVEITAFKEGLRFYLERSGGKPTSAIADLAGSLKAIARHHLRADQGHLDSMAAMIRRLDTGRRGLTELNRARLRPLDDRANVLALLQLPAKLMTIASRKRQPRLGAILAQIAVATEILLMAPIRIGNLVNLDLERNLVRPGRGKALHIVIEREQVKNREPLEFPLPPQSVALIERYIQEFRPCLAPASNTALFPGEGGKPKRRHTLGKQISDKSMSTPVCGSIRICFAMPPPSSFSMHTPEAMKSCGGSWDIARSTPRPATTLAWKPRPRSAISTRRFSSCVARAFDDQDPSSRPGPALQED